MTEYLRNQGYWVSPKRTARLMRVMGLRALVPKKSMTRSNPGHKIYPFTSHSFTERLESTEVKISMDGRGRVFDNIFIERLWRTVKYEDIYLRNYVTAMELERGLAQYFQFYNNERFHQSLDYKTPVQVYYDCQRTTDSDG